jgi:DNA-binding FadR family transcriptional regulator
MLSVREAVRALQARGLVETRHGVGTFVRGQSDDDGIAAWMLGAGEVDEYVELVEARSYIETAIVELAARRRSDTDLQHLDTILARMRAARQDSAAFIEADADFHLTLAEAGHNRVLMRSMLGIRLPMQRLMANRIVAHLEQFGDLDGPVSDHEQIVEAVRRGEPGPGADAMDLITRRGIAHLQTLRSTSP